MSLKFNNIKDIIIKYYIKFSDNIDNDIIIDIFNDNINNYLSNPLYCRTIGQYYMYKVKDYDNAFKYYKFAEENGIMDAYFSLGNYYVHVNNIDEAIKYYNLGIENNVLECISNLGHLYHYNLNDPTKAEEYYLMGCEKKHIVSMYYLCSFYMGKQHIEKSLQYCNMAIDYFNTMNNINNNVNDIFTNLIIGNIYGIIGCIYYNKHNFNEAMKYLKLGYEKENLVSTFYISDYYNHKMSKNLDEYFKYVREFKKIYDKCCEDIIKCNKQLFIHRLIMTYVSNNIPYVLSDKLFLEYMHGVCKYYYNINIDNDIDNLITKYKTIIDIFKNIKCDSKICKYNTDNNELSTLEKNE